MKRLRVEHGGREREVLIPATGDPIYDRDLEQMAREKTLSELQKLPPKETPKHSKEETAGALKEMAAWRNRRKGQVNPKKYY